MGFTLLGMLLLSKAGSFTMVLAATSLVVSLVDLPPESSRMARAASGGRTASRSPSSGRRNFGSALGPLLAAFIVLRKGSRASPGSRSPRCAMMFSCASAAGTREAGDACRARAASARTSGVVAPGRDGV